VQKNESNIDSDVAGPKTNSVFVTPLSKSNTYIATIEIEEEDKGMLGLLVEYLDNSCAADKYQMNTTVDSLSIDDNANESGMIVVKSFRRQKETERILPAERCGQLKIGDRIRSVNGISLLGVKSSKECLLTIKAVLEKEQQSMQQERTRDSNINDFVNLHIEMESMTKAKDAPVFLTI